MDSTKSQQDTNTKPAPISRLSVINILALVSYSLSILFHLIAYCTNNWWSFTVDGTHIKVGIWKGCKSVSSDSSWKCSDEVFNNKLVTADDWHVGVRTLVTVALVALFAQEFALFAYVFIKRLQIFRDRLAFVVIGISVLTGICSFLTLIITGTEAAKQPGANIDWSYGLEILCLVFTCLTAFLIILERMISKEKITKRNCVFRYLSKMRFKREKDPEPLTVTPIRLSLRRYSRMQSDLISTISDTATVASTGSYVYSSIDNLADRTAILADIVNYNDEPRLYKPDVLI